MSTTIKARRAKGDGALFQNSKGKWVGRYKGKEFTGDQKTAVKESLDHYKFLVQFGIAFTKNVSVKNYGEKFLYHKAQQMKRGKLKNNSLDRLERTYENQIVGSTLTNISMRNLNGVAIQDFIDTLSESYSFSTIKKAYLFLQAMITFGVERGDLPKDYDPLKTVELPDEDALNVKTKEIEIIPDDQVERFKKVAMSLNSDGTHVYRYGPLLVFGLNTGLREGELIALSEKGVLNVANGRKAYHVYETVSTVKNRDKDAVTKTTRIITAPKYPRSVRNVPLNQEAADCLNIMLKSYSGNTFRRDLIVSTKNGLLPTARNIQTSLDRILTKAGLPHYGTHAMRHTFATNLLKQTVSHQQIKAVAEILGDDYKVVVKTYLHTEEEGKHDLVDLLIAN